MALSDACAEFLDQLVDGAVEPKLLVRRLLVELDRDESYGHVHDGIKSLRSACEAYLAKHPGTKLRRELESMVRLALVAKRVRVYQEGTSRPRIDEVWLRVMDNVRCLEFEDLKDALVAICDDRDDDFLSWLLGEV